MADDPGSGCGTAAARQRSSATTLQCRESPSVFGPIRKRQLVRRTPPEEDGLVKESVCRRPRRAERAAQSE